MFYIVEKSNHLENVVLTSFLIFILFLMVISFIVAFKKPKLAVFLEYLSALTLVISIATIFNLPKEYYLEHTELVTIKADVYDVSLVRLPLVKDNTSKSTVKLDLLKSDLLQIKHNDNSEILNKLKQVN